MCREIHGDRTHMELPCPLKGATLPAPPLIHQPRNSLNPVLWVAMETSLQVHDWLHRWPLVTELNPAPLPSLKNGVRWLKFLTFCSRLVPIATSPLPLLRGFPKSHHEGKPHWGRKGLVWVTRYPIYLYVSEAISGTEDKKPNITAKDAPVACVAQKFQEVRNAWARNCGIRPNIYLVIKMTKYIFLINHNMRLWATHVSCLAALSAVFRANHIRWVLNLPSPASILLSSSFTFKGPPPWSRIAGTFRSADLQPYSHLQLYFPFAMQNSLLIILVMLGYNYGHFRDEESETKMRLS